MRRGFQTLLRPFYIGLIVLRYGLDTILLDSFRHPGLKTLSKVLSFGRRHEAPRGARLREAF